MDSRDQESAAAVEIRAAIRCLRSQAGRAVQVSLSAPADGGHQLLARIDGRLRSVLELGQGRDGPIVVQLDVAAILIRRSRLSGIWLEPTTPKAATEYCEVSFELEHAGRVEVSWAPRPADGSELTSD